MFEIIHAAKSRKLSPAILLALLLSSNRMNDASAFVASNGRSMTTVGLTEIAVLQRRQCMKARRSETHLCQVRTTRRNKHGSSNSSSNSNAKSKSKGMYLSTSEMVTMEKKKETDFSISLPFFVEEAKASKEDDSFEQSVVLKEVAESADSLESEDSFGSGLFWRGVVVLLCALWASNFAAAKLVMAEPGVDSSLYAVARFSLAALALVPGSIAAVRRGVIDWETAWGAAGCGAWVAFGYLGQTLGLLTTTASRSCVICTLHCVFVAALTEFMRINNNTNGNINVDANVSIEPKESQKQTFDFMKLIPAAVAVLGVAIVELKGAAGQPTIGDLLSFAQPIGFGMGYIQLEQLVRKKPQAGLPISAIKLLVVAASSFGLFEFFPLLQVQSLASFALQLPDFTPILSSPLALSGILYTGLITTALALWVESIAFKRVPATDASIILTTEPLFAALAGAFTLGETFGTSDYFGATLIIGACALAVLLGEEEQHEGLEKTKEQQSSVLY